jgi:hypothetical protein
METISRENLPKSMRYSLMSVPAVEAETNLARFDSNNSSGSFTFGGANEIRIKVKANGFLDAPKHYLYFSITTATADAHLDGNAGSLFDRMTIECAGSQVEQINSYALYNGVRSSYNAPLHEIMKKNAESGGGRLAIQNEGADAGADDGKIVGVALSSLGEKITSGHSKNYCIQLQSGLLMNHKDKALPDGLMEIELVLRLANPKSAFVEANGTNATYTINNPRLYAPVYRILNGDVLSAYNQLVATQGVMWCGDTAKTYINTVSASAGAKTAQINDRSVSCKALVSVLRDTDADTTQEQYSNNSFCLALNNTKVNEYVYKIAGQNYPQSQVVVATDSNGRDIGRAYEETIKALAKHGARTCETIVSREQFTATSANYASATSTGGINTAKGLMCVDLKKFDDHELRNIGLNTASNASPSVLEFNLTGAPNAEMNLTTFSICEATFIMDGTGRLQVSV